MTSKASPKVFVGGGGFEGIAAARALATPMSIMVATGRGATSGILFRDAEAILDAEP